MAGDPRPRLKQTDRGAVLEGQRCERCGYAVAVLVPRCQRCGGQLVATEFGPQAEVWASTVVHLPVAGLAPPYGLAYVDLVDDGPRILAHTSGERPLAIGSVVRLSGMDAAGNMVAVPA